MKSIFKLPIVFILLLLAFNSYSQIQILENDLFIRGKYQMATDTNGGYTIGTAGANKTWDFSNLKSNTTYLKEIKDYQGKVKDANKIEIDDNDTTNYYQKSSMGVTIILPIEDFGIPIYQKIKAFNFPITYMSVNKDSTTIINYVSGDDFGFPQVDSIRINLKIIVSSVVDAWGSIKIPMGNYNALRVKTSTRTIGKFAAKTGKFPYINIPGSEIDESSTDYIWATNAKGSFLASYSENDDIMEFMTSSLEVNSIKNKVSEITVSNPIGSELIVKNPSQNNYMIFLFDESGKQIHSQKIQSCSNQVLETSFMPLGNYYIQYLNLTTQSVSYQKLIK